ncbi:MAG: hypothetical protein KDE26_08410 [Bacteroidetes bacterium]|nr:hypothetical protein [Bacteroidota bacterium]
MKFILAFILNTFNHGWQAAVKKYRSITSTSLDEMLFENREKEYGAYMLRKNYPWHLVTALTVVILVFLYLCFLPVFMGWLAKYRSPQPTGIKYVPKEISLHKEEKKGFITPASNTFMSKADLEGIRVYFQIPKPSVEVENNPHKENWKGKGDSTWNATTYGHSSFYIDPDLDPDTTLVPGNQYPPIKMLPSNIIDDFFCGLTPKPDNRLPEKMVDEQEPATCGCILFVDEEPQPINLEEVKNCITLAPGQSSYYFVFRVLVDKRGNYVKHRLVRGQTHRYSKKIGNCLSQLHFTPAIHKGKPFPFWVNIPFRLEFE